VSAKKPTAQRSLARERALEYRGPLLTYIRAAHPGQPVPMTFVDLAIKLAMRQTGVAARCRFLAFGVPGVPLAGRIVFAHGLLGICGA